MDEVSVVVMIMVVVVVIMVVVVVVVIMVVVIMLVVVMIMVVVVMTMVFDRISVAVTMAVTMTVAMTVAMIVSLKQSAQPRDDEAGNQGCRQQQTIVPVKLEFRQKVRRGDADEGARAHGEGVGREIVPCPDAVDEEEEQDAHGDHQREQQIHENDASARRTTHPHHGGDGECIERLVKKNREKRSQSRKPSHGGRGISAGVARLHRMVHEDRGCQCDAREQGVHGHAEEGSDPAEGVLAMNAVMMSVRGGFLDLVMMKAEEAFEEEDQEKTAQERRGHACDGCAFRAHEAAWQQSHTEKNPGDERKSHLHSKMRQPDQKREKSPQHGCERDQDAIDDEKPEHEERSRYERMNVQV